MTAFAFRVGLFNTHCGEGVIVGTNHAAIWPLLLATALTFLPVLQIPCSCFVVGTAGGAGISAIGWLKAQFGINEVITSTIMFNWIQPLPPATLVSLPQFRQPAQLLLTPLTGPAIPPCSMA